jgi:AraC-like DNA-binding protein
LTEAPPNLTETQIAHRQASNAVVCYANSSEATMPMSGSHTTGTGLAGTPTGLVSVLTTNSVAESERLDFWREVVCRTIAGVEATALVPSRPYAGSILAQSIPLAHLPNFDLIQVEADAQFVTRTRRLIDQTEGAWLLMIQEDGVCEVRQGDRKTRLTPGDIGFLDTSRPYEVTFPQSFKQSILKMPEILFRDIAPRGDDLAGVALPGGQTLTDIARQTLLTLKHGAAVIEPVFLPAAANCAIDQLSLAMRAVRRSEARKIIQHSSSDHVARADLYISNHLHDAKLSVEQVAKALGVSAGYLQQLYRQTKSLGIAQSILDRRLAHCRKELADPSLADESVTSIAFRWGFSESSSFSRAFRRTFGVSPRQYRRLSRNARNTTAT